MEFELADKVVLVAAASRGLGRAVAEELAAEGAQLIICARREQAIRDTADEIAERHGVEVLPVAADLATAGAAQRVVDAGVEKFRRIDVLVTNAGGPPAGPFE